MREIWRISSVKERVLRVTAQNQTWLLELAGQKHSYETVCDPERYDKYDPTSYNFIAAVAAGNVLQALGNVSDHLDKQTYFTPNLKIRL